MGGMQHAGMGVAPLQDHLTTLGHLFGTVGRSTVTGSKREVGPGQSILQIQVAGEIPGRVEDLKVGPRASQDGNRVANRLCAPHHQQHLREARNLA